MADGCRASLARWSRVRWARTGAARHRFGLSIACGTVAISSAWIVVARARDALPRYSGRQLVFPDQRVDGRDDEQRQHATRDHPPHHRRSDPFHDAAACTGGPENR